jgi:phosphatidyl-myo-inositol dimannoside synthase
MGPACIRLRRMVSIRALVLTTDAFGGMGGIAQYNRDLLTALTDVPGMTEVVAIPRIVPGPPQALPPKLQYVAEAGGGKVRFARAALRGARGRFDLIVCGHVNLLPIAGLLRLRHRAPLVLVVYGIDVWKPHASWLVRRLIRRVDGVWSISEITRDRMMAWSGVPAGRFTILPNAIDLARYRPGPRNAEFARRLGLTDRKVIMMLGRLSAAERYKGVDEVLEVLPMLVQQEPRLTFVVAGDGDDRDRLVRKARELNVAGNVLFTGFVSEDEKTALLRLADGFVMPGRGEGFGFVFLEAMACGTPVVASRVDGSREAVRNGLLGRLVDPDDRVELQASILEVLRAPRAVPEGLSYFDRPHFEARVTDATLKLVAR